MDQNPDPDMMAHIYDSLNGTNIARARVVSRGWLAADRALQGNARRNGKLLAAEETATLQRRLTRVVAALENGTLPFFTIKTHWGDYATIDANRHIGNLRQFLMTLTPKFIKTVTMPGEGPWSYDENIIYECPEDIQPLSERQTLNLVADSGYF